MRRLQSVADEHTPRLNPRKAGGAVKKNLPDDAVTSTAAVPLGCENSAISSDKSYPLPVEKIFYIV